MDDTTTHIYTSEPQVKTSHSPSDFRFVERDEYPVGTTVRLANGEIAWVVSVGKKTMVKLKKSTVIRQAKDGYAIISGLFAVPKSGS